MKTSPSHSAFALFTLLLFGCGSPLFHHTNAESGIRQPLLESTSSCPIEFPSEGLCASWSWERIATDQDSGTAILRFWKNGEATEAGPYVPPSGDVFVKLWMPAMGHGSSPTSTRPKLDPSGAAIPGVYEVSNIFFVMPGEWEAWIQVKTNDQVRAQAKLGMKI